MRGDIGAVAGGTVSVLSQYPAIAAGGAGKVDPGAAVTALDGRKVSVLPLPASERAKLAT